MTDVRGPGGPVAPTTNWAGNVTYRAARVLRPSSVDELRRVVAGSPRLRPLGTGHSFSDVVDTTGDLVSVAGLPPTVELDEDRRTVTVGAGMRYGELAEPLHRAGWALPNLGSLPHICVAGAVATGTHGSGDANGCLATSVSGLEMVNAAGDLVHLTRADGDRFRGAVVALGALGVVTRLTLDVVPTFEVRQHVYDGLSTDNLLQHWDEVFSRAYSVSVFTDWSHQGNHQVWLKERVSDEPRRPDPEWLGTRPADGPRHPIPGADADSITEQRGVPGPWHERLPHFRLGFTPSSGDELQSEYLVPRDRAADALAAVARIAHLVSPVLQVSEVRTVAADDLWLSPAYGRDSLAIHFTWVSDTAAVLPTVAAVEEAVMPFAPRPHWGKVFGIAPDDVRATYDRADDFRSLAADLDPSGKLRNDFLDRYLPPAP